MNCVFLTSIHNSSRRRGSYSHWIPFDKCNDDGKIAWYDTNAYNPKHSLQNKMNTISSAYSELSKSHLDYVKFYMENHKQIPTWIMLKVVNFSTFILFFNIVKQMLRFNLSAIWYVRYKQPSKCKTINW